jgi:hypothetical protein
MIEALRGLGYSTATALADVIDNSIAANATRVDLIFGWRGAASYVAIIDDGCGMSDSELERAMRLGERSPKDERSAHDLGRFGLGLKTASFSQCRRLTVASRKAGSSACLRWDLDEISCSAGDGWRLLEGPAQSSADLVAELLPHERGTLVLWEVLDRVVTPGFAEQHLLDLIDRIEQHLSMVFHRYLEGKHPPLTLTINGRLLAPWDPFLTSHPATWSSPAELLPTGTGAVEVRCHVLPHKDRLAQREYESTAGPDGWTAQQGFYVYRNRRLLVAGSWLGLGQGRSWTKEEAHRLARIRLDIENSADEAWKIDIRKSTARPPVAIRARLTRLAEDTRERARRVFAWRGRAIRLRSNQELAHVWRTEHTRGGVRYRVDENHPAVRAVLDDAGSLRTAVRAMLRVIEETLPVQRIWLDTAEGRETPRTGFSVDPPAEVVKVLRVMFRNLVERRGLSPDLAREQLSRTEPFNDYPELVAALPDAPSWE